MTTTASVAGPLDPIGADLHRTLKQLKLGQMTQTLPERLVLARQQKMSHTAFLELILSDEIIRRESRSAMLRARAAGLDPAMRLDTFDELDDLSYDWELLADLATPAVHPSRSRRARPRPGRSREDPPRHRVGTHRDPPPTQRARRPSRQAVHPTPRRPAGQQPRR